MPLKSSLSALLNAQQIHPQLKLRIMEPVEIGGRQEEDGPLH